MRIDNSWLQAGALCFAGAIAITAAVQDRWDIVGAAMTGFFAVLNIHPREPAPPPDDPDQNPRSGSRAFTE